VTTGAAIVFLLPVGPLESKNRDPQADDPAPVYVRLPCGMAGPLAALGVKSKGCAAVFAINEKDQRKSTRRQTDSVRRKTLENKKGTWNEDRRETVPVRQGFA
jgi:hypothetical protein